MEDANDRLLKCGVCLSNFDPEGHKPLLLPKCGHTFCVFCLDALHKQSKNSCPECRKENAVSSVSSLPVNYSLLALAQSSTSAVSRTSSARPKVSKPSRSESPPKSVTSINPSHYRPQIQPVPKPRLSLNQPTVQPLSFSGREPRRPHEQLRGRNMEHKSYNRTHITSDEEEARNLQEEMDFQMAVHLTFCKDKSHRHDDPAGLSHCWQYQDDEDVHKPMYHSY